MAHHFFRTTTALAVTAALAVGTVGSVEARPRPNLGPVSGLALTVAHADSYAVTADWDTLPGATRYAVKMSSSGTRLATDTVTASSWTATTTLPAGTQVSVTVTPYDGRRKGKAATVSKLLPDVTAPEAAYSVVRDEVDPTGGSVRIHRDALADDLSPLSGITQTIAWDRGQDPVPWPSAQADISHDYGNAEHVYHPVITVQDAAHNTATYELAVAVRDSLAPQGDYTAGPTSAFARWTQVGLTELDISDNLSADQDMLRIVDWGDGTVQTWSPDLRHVYAGPGSYQPQLQLSDEAGNDSPWLPTSSVEVTADTNAPLTSLRVPRKAQSRVATWNTLRGRLDDRPGVGAKAVTVKVAELRRGSWYGYRAATHTWVKTANKRAALRKATGTARPTLTHRWAMPVTGLRPGTLVIKYRGADLLLNRTPWLTYQQRLTRA